MFEAVLLAIVLPALLWVGYLYYKDRLHPEPLLKLGISYVLGFGSAGLCWLLFDLIDAQGWFRDPMWLIEHDRQGFLVYALVVIGPLEELTKLLPFLLICTRFKAFDEVIDGIIYASMVALGFASLENILYMQFVPVDELMARAVSSPLVHMVFATTWGLAYAWARFSGRSTLLWTTLGLIVSALAHGLYDWLATDADIVIASAGVIMVVWVWRLWVLSRLHRKALLKTQR